MNFVKVFTQHSNQSSNERSDLKTFGGIFLAGLLSLGLLACGGGGGSGSSTPINPVGSLITAGAYMGTVGGKDWISILLPTDASANSVTQFYALHYNAVDPDIYNGAGQITGNSSAMLTKLSVFPNIAASVRTGTGSLTSASSGVVRADLSFAATSSDIALRVNLDHSAPTGYTYNTPATLASVKDVWQGRWSYGVGFADNFSINVSAQGAVTSSAAFQNDCQLTQSTLTPSADGTNLLNWTATIPNATQCSLKNQTLTGAAFVTPSPVAGKTQRIYLVGVTADGRGVSFKADR